MWSSKKNDAARHRLLHQYLADRSAGAGGGDATGSHDMSADRAPGGRAGAGRGAGGFAVQDDAGVHRGGEGEARRAEVVGRLDHLARERRAPAADAGDRRALGVHLVPGRRRAHRGAARRPCRHDDRRSERGRRAGARRQAARHRAGRPTAACRASRTFRRIRRRASTFRTCRRCAASSARPACRPTRSPITRTCSSRSAKTPAWQKFLKESQLDGEFVRGQGAQAVPDEFEGSCARS